MSDVSLRRPAFVFPLALLLAGSSACTLLNPIPDDWVGSPSDATHEGNGGTAINQDILQNLQRSVTQVTSRTAVDAGFEGGFDAGADASLSMKMPIVLRTSVWIPYGMQAIVEQSCPAPLRRVAAACERKPDVVLMGQWAVDYKTYRCQGYADPQQAPPDPNVDGLLVLALTCAGP